MNYDISESISQGSLRAQDAENRRIEEIADELHRRCQLHEAELHESGKHVNPFEIEQREAEALAKSKGFWIPMDHIFKIGIPGPSGNENDTYTSEDKIYKVNNLLNSGSIGKLFEKTLFHNAIFPETAYSFFGFAGYDGRSVMPIFTQDLVKDAAPATNIEIETYMAALGFRREQETGRYTNDVYAVWDLVPRNVLRDRDGDIFVVDAEIKRNY